MYYLKKYDTKNDFTCDIYSRARYAESVCLTVQDNQPVFAQTTKKFDLNNDGVTNAADGVVMTNTQLYGNGPLKLVSGVWVFTLPDSATWFTDLTLFRPCATYDQACDQIMNYVVDGTITYH